jgi:alpha-D-ribose 1-methylphosphonate 5-triphosphate diphosphatase
MPSPTASSTSPTLRREPPEAGAPAPRVADAPATFSLFSRQVVFEDSVVAATLHVADGLIAAVDIGTQRPGALDLGEDILMPGLVELHTDHLEPHFTPRPGVRWNALAAVFAYDAQIATAGITTVFDSLRAGGANEADPERTGLEELGRAIENARASGLLRADHHTHLRCEICSPEVVEEARRHVIDFDVRLMSLMDHTPGARQFRDEEKLRIYYRGKSNKSEAELDAFFAERRALHLRYHSAHRRQLVELARGNGVTLASHDDTTEEHVAESVADGIRIAEFPTTVEAAVASHAAGLDVLMGAPNVVRGGSHSGNVSALDLAQAGVLDILSSDYVPASLIDGAFALRRVPQIGGLAGALRLVTANPARATGLLDRGRIAPGLRADLLRVALIGDRPVVRHVYREGERVA